MNRYQPSPQAMLANLRLVNQQEEGWNITNRDLDRLADTVPDLPEGRLVFLSFRIRWGEGDEGVALTFKRHVERIQRVFEEQGVWYDIRPRLSASDGDVECPRLRAGNQTHVACIEWVIIDLGANREREGLQGIQCGPKSLADELLVAAWLFPDLIEDVDHDTIPSFLAGGYELDDPDPDSGRLYNILIGRSTSGERQVFLISDYLEGLSSDCSVPELRSFS